MLVKNYMTRHPIMIEPHKRIFEAQQIMVENGVRHLPVIGDGKRLLGLVTRQRMQVAPERLASLEVWEITRYLSDMTVENVMVKGDDLHTISPEATVEDAADLMIRHKVGGLPVIEDGMVVGLITETDLLIELRDILGAFESGWRVTVRVPDRLGEFTQLAQAITGKGWCIMSMGGVRTPKDSERWDAVIKVTGCTKEELQALIEESEEHQIVDLRETTYSN